MTSPRLELQFIRLWQAFEGKETETTLQELAETLHCTRRHVRSLLNKMHQTEEKNPPLLFTLTPLTSNKAEQSDY